MSKRAATHIDLARWLLRIGLAFAYAYVVIEMRVNPSDFLKYIPSFTTHLIPLQLFFWIFGIAETILTLWFLSGHHTEYAGLISFFLMLGIVAFNMPLFSILFRDITIAFASLALTALDYAPSSGLAK